MLAKIANFLIIHAAIVIPLVVVVLMVVSASVRSGVAFVVRVVARLLLIVAVIALVYDGTRTLASGSSIVLTSLIEHWQTLAPQSLAVVKTMVGHLHPLAWEQGALRVARLPAWLVIGVLGFLLAWLGRKRQRTNVYVN